MRKIAVLLFMICSLCQVMAQDNITWGSPVTISNSTLDNSSDPHIKLDSSGNATAAWVENGFVYASNQPIGGSWGTPVALSSSGSTSPRLAVDGSGNVTALWVSSGGVVKVATLPFGGSWSGATTLSASGASNPSLAVNASGNAVAVWQRSGFIEAATKLIAGLWSLVSQISPANSSTPDVSVGTNGTVVAVWTTVLGTGEITVESATQTAIGGVWGSAVNILPAPSAFSMGYPHVSVDANGNADVVWWRYLLTSGTYSNVFVYAASLPVSSTTWSFPLQISAIGIRNPADLSLRIGTDPAGNKMAVWTQSYDGQTFDVESAAKPISGAWSLVSTILQTADYYTLGADLSVNSLGDAIVVFMNFDGTNINIESSETSSASPLDSSPFWSNPILFSTGSDNGFPRLASAFDGTNVDAVAVWLAFNGTNVVVQASTGSRAALAPPTSLSVTQSSTNFGVYTDYVNTISWTASTSSNAAGYVIFRNGLFISAVGSTTTTFSDHNELNGGPVTYTLATFDNQQTQSKLVSVSYP